MKRIHKLAVAACGAALIMVFSCKSPTTVSNEYATYGFETQCMGAGSDGTQLLRTWGSGVDKSRAIEQAQRNALEAVLFRGVAGQGDCAKRPLVNGANPRERHQDYFNAFLGDKNAYGRYVSLEENKTSRIKSKNASMEAWSVIVRVDMDALRRKLVDDNIIGTDGI